MRGWARGRARPNRAGLVMCVALAACSGDTGSGPASGSPSGSPGTAATAVHVLRSPGLLVLPPVDRTISDRATVDTLGRDIAALARVPNRTAAHCPIDLGTVYTLTFDVPGGVSWTATLRAQGCRAVTVRRGRSSWTGVASTALWDDLGSALRLSVDEVQPRLCQFPGEGHCFNEATPRP